MKKILFLVAFLLLAMPSKAQQMAAKVSTTGTTLATSDWAGTGTLSSKWTVGQATVDVVSAHAEAKSSVSGTYPYASWNAVTWPTNQWSKATLIVNGLQSQLGPGVRISAGKNYYGLFASGNFKLAYLFKSVNGAITILQQVAHKPVTGDAWELDVQGSTLTAYLNGAQVMQKVDTSLASGAAGIIGHASVANPTSGQLLASWSGGNFTVASHSVALAWTGSASSGITSYGIYRSTTSGSGYVKIGSTTAAVHAYTDSTVASHVTYYYVVQAISPACPATPTCGPSVMSGQVAAVIP